VKDNNKACRRSQGIRHKRVHPKATWIGSKTSGFNQRAVGAGPQVAPKVPETMGGRQLWQTSQIVDILGEGHRQLLGET
jgi:hypothetical protein